MDTIQPIQCFVERLFTDVYGLTEFLCDQTILCGDVGISLNKGLHSDVEPQREVIELHIGHSVGVITPILFFQYLLTFPNGQIVLSVEGLHKGFDRCFVKDVLSPNPTVLEGFVLFEMSDYRWGEVC